MYTFIKFFLFFISPEKAHRFTMYSIGILFKTPIIGRLFSSFLIINNKKLVRNVFGLNFPNPVGLAAGFDKDGKYFSTIANLGFGFIEIGTVTPKGQLGNAQPRLFRLPKDNALINRMGFNNEGVDALVKRLQEKRHNSSIIIGGNIGKNKLTPNEKAKEDYAYCFEKLFPYVDYFVVNVSSPNTPNLRELQEKKPLTELLTFLQKLNTKKAKQKPILLKIAPDLTNQQLDDILFIAKETQLAGIIATNTTISRAQLQSTKESLRTIGAGGLSGQPLKKRSTEVIRYLHQKSNGQLTIIGVGGINSASDAIEKLEAGATLLQIYTGLIYQGPGLVKRINQAILKNKIK